MIAGPYSIRPPPRPLAPCSAEPDRPFPSEQRPFRAENFDQLVLVINACSYDEALLSGCLHPPRLRLLASRDGLLHVDSAQRATLALVQAELAAVQASMARAKQEQPEAEENHRENKKKPKQLKGPCPNHSKTIGKTK